MTPQMRKLVREVHEEVFGNDRKSGHQTTKEKKQNDDNKNK